METFKQKIIDEFDTWINRLNCPDKPSKHLVYKGKRISPSKCLALLQSDDEEAFQIMLRILNTSIRSKIKNKPIRKQVIPVLWNFFSFKYLPTKLKDQLFYCTVWAVFLVGTFAMVWIIGTASHHFIDQIGQPIVTIDGQLIKIEKPKNIPACYFHVRLDLDGYSVKATRYMGTSKFGFMHFDEKEWVWVDYRIGRSGKVYLTDVRKIIE